MGWWHPDEEVLPRKKDPDKEELQPLTRDIEGRGKPVQDRKVTVRFRLLNSEMAK